MILKSTNGWAAVVVAFLFCSASPLLAAVDNFLVIPGIPGESTDAQFPNSFQTTGFSESMANAITVVSTGVVSNTPTLGTVSFSKYVDKGSPLLYLACAQGTQLQNPVVFYFRNATGGNTTNIFYSVTLSNVWVKSVQSAFSNDSGMPTENVTLTCGQIQWSYAAVNANGTYQTPIVHSWNAQTGTGN